MKIAILRKPLTSIGRVGLEPTWVLPRRILSPLRLPFRHRPGSVTDSIVTLIAYAYNGRFPVNRPSRISLLYYHHLVSGEWPCGNTWT